MAFAFALAGTAGCASLIGADFDRELHASEGRPPGDEGASDEHDTSIDDSRKDAGNAEDEADARESAAPDVANEDEGETLSAGGNHTCGVKADDTVSPGSRRGGARRTCEAEFTHCVRFGGYRQDACDASP